MLHSERLIQWKEKFEYCLSVEFSDPAYFEMHHLLVITYMLQTDSYHPQYRATAIHLLRDWLDDRISPDAFRAAFNAAPKSGTILQAEEQRNPFQFGWHKDILSVQTATAQAYERSIGDWAWDVLAVLTTSPSS